MSYDELIELIQTYTIRTDIPVEMLMRLAEASLRPIAKHYLAEKTVTLTVTDEIAELPTDLLEIRAITGAIGKIYKPISPVATELYDGEIGYYRVGDSISFVPHSASTVDAQVTLLYRYSFPNLTDTQSNWLFERFPNIYVRAILKEANRWLKDAEGVATEDAALKEELGILAEDDRDGRKTGPIYWSPSAWQ